MRFIVFFIFLFQISFATAYDCDLLFSAKGKLVDNFWNRAVTKIKGPVKKFDQAMFNSAVSDVKNGRLPATDTLEGRLAFITTTLDSEIPKFSSWVENFAMRTRKEQKQLVNLSKTFNKKGILVERKVDKYLSKYYKVNYQSPKGIWEPLNNMEGVFAAEMKQKIWAGLLKKNASAQSILKNKTFFRKSIERLFANKRFQLVSNIFLNTQALATGSVPFIMKYRFYKISPKMVEEAMLYGTETAIKRFYSLNKHLVKKQVLFDSAKTLFNRLMVGIFISGTIYHVVQQSKEDLAAIEEAQVEADEILNNSVNELERDIQANDDLIDKIDPRTDLFNMSLDLFEKEQGYVLDSNDQEYLDIWKEVFEADYPEKLEI